MLAVDDAVAIAQREIVHRTRPELVGESKAGGLADVQTEDVSQRLRRQDVFPDPGEIADAETERAHQAIDVDVERFDRRQRGCAGSRHRLATPHLAPEIGVPVHECEDASQRPGDHRGQVRRSHS